MMKKNNKIIRLISMSCLFLMIQACSVPASNPKKPDTTLPESYSVSTKGAAAKSNSNTADMKWKAFFDDPDLLNLIEIAVANNKEINIMLQRVNAAANEVQARKGEYLPFVSLGVGADVDKAAHYTRNGASEGILEIVEGEEFPEYLANYQFGLFASWEIDIWKKLRNASKVAAFEYMASKEGKNFLVTNLVAEIAHLYYELVALDNHFGNLEQNIQLQTEGIDTIRELMQYGRTNMLAIKRYEAEVSKNKSQMYEIKQDMVEVENKINLLLGRAPQPINRSSGGFLDLKPKAMHVGVPSQLLQNRPDIRRAELELTAASLNIDVAKADFYPSLEIKAGVGYQAFQTQYLLAPESLALMLAGEIAAPIVNRSAIIARYKNANARQIQAAFDYEQTIINAFTEVSNKISNIDNLESQYQLKRDQVRSLTESINLVNQLFVSARADYLEILLTQREALEARMELIETKQDQMVATVDLYRALGGGWH